jgi:hypothetical protein
MSTHLHHVFRTNGFGYCVRCWMGAVKNNLCDAITVTQVDKDKITMIAPTMYPSGQRHLLTGMSRTQFTTGV